jgi:hypothetical protein
MRNAFRAGILLAVFGLSACGEAKQVADTAPPPTKSMTRSRQFYAGQEQVLKVDAAKVAVRDGSLIMTATGAVPSSGYINAGFMTRINAVPPRDGVYEFDVVADRPSGGAAEAVTPIKIDGGWSAYPPDRLKGVRLYSKTNSVTAMLPTG